MIIHLLFICSWFLWIFFKMQFQMIHLSFSVISHIQIDSICVFGESVNFPSNFKYVHKSSALTLNLCIDETRSIEGKREFKYPFSSKLHLCVCCLRQWIMWLHFFFHSLLRLYYPYATCRYGKFHKSFDSLIRKAIINLHRLFSQLKSKRRVSAYAIWVYCSFCAVVVVMVAAAAPHSMRFMLHYTMVDVFWATAWRSNTKKKKKERTAHKLNDFTLGTCLFPTFSPVLCFSEAFHSHFQNGINFHFFFFVCFFYKLFQTDFYFSCKNHFYVFNYSLFFVLEFFYFILNVMKIRRQTQIGKISSW